MPRGLSSIVVTAVAVSASEFNGDVGPVTHIPASSVKVVTQTK